MKRRTFATAGSGQRGMTFPLAVAFALGTFLQLPAQESAAQRHAMATNHLKRVTTEMSARCLEDVRTLEDWKRQRDQRRRELMEMLGLQPLPKRTPLRAQITGTLERPAYRVEKLVFQSSPGLYVTGNFYVPRDARRPLPTILYLCGHTPHPQGAKTQFQDRAQWFATHGYPVLVLDTLEFAEVEGPHHGTHNLHYWHWLSLGYTPAGVEVWNAIRALDYLETRPEVDMKRIGLTGISGGGAMTWYTAAVDERIAVAAPSCATFTHGSQAEHWLAYGQCDCIYYINTYAWDFPLVGALIAPRPLIILSGQKDTIFPPDGYHAVFQRAKRVYDLYAGGSSDRIREVDEDVPHSDSPLLLAEARQWMQRWLKNDPAPVPLEEKGALAAEKPEDLACLTAPPADAINDRIHDQFIPLSRASGVRSRGAWEKRRGQLLAELRAKVFDWFPKEAIPFETQVTRNTGGWSARYADFKEATFASEPGVRIRAQRYTPKNSTNALPLLIHVKRPRDSFYSSDFDERLPVLDRASVLVVTPRFTEPTLSTAEYTHIERTAVWSGRTIAAMQVWDTLRAIKWAVEEEKIPATRVMLFGREDAGIVALYAALFDDRVSAVILGDPPSSHWQGPALLNALRITDIPEVAGALAPREVIFLRATPAGFTETKELLKRIGNASALRVAGSLAAALNLAR
jgi:cephalosporin-C deacetylase-like acetyl esterase